MRPEKRANVASTVDVAVPRPMADIFAMFGHVHLDILLGEVEAGVAGLARAKLVHEDHSALAREIIANFCDGRGRLAGRGRCKDGVAEDSDAAVVGPKDVSEQQQQLQLLRQGTHWHRL